MPSEHLPAINLQGLAMHEAAAIASDGPLAVLDQVQGIPYGRLLSYGTDSQETFELIQGWIDGCLRRHECQTTALIARIYA